MAPPTWFDAARANDYPAVSEAMEIYAGSISNEGDTALILAAENNAVEVVKLLIAKESHMVNKSGLTALMQASLLNCVEAAELLAPLEANICMSDGRDAFMLASSRGNIEVMKTIHPYFSLRTDRTGFSALDHAVIENREDAVKFILQNRVTTVKDLETALLLAVEKEYLNIYELLRDKSNSLINTNLRDSHRYDNLIRNPSIGNSFMQASSVSQTSRADERAITFSRTTSPRSSIAINKTPGVGEEQWNENDDIAIMTLKNSNDLLRKENKRLQDQVKTLQDQVNASADILSVVSNTSSPQGNPFNVDSGTLSRRAASLRIAEIGDGEDVNTLRTYYEQQLANANARADGFERKLQEYIKASKQSDGADYLQAAIYERDRELAILVHEFVNKTNDLRLSVECDSSVLQRRESIGDNVSSTADVIPLQNPHFKTLRILLERAQRSVSVPVTPREMCDIPNLTESITKIHTPAEPSQEECFVANRSQLKMIDRSIETVPTESDNLTQAGTPDISIAAIALQEKRNRETIPNTPVIDTFMGVDYYKELLRQKDAEIARLSLNTLAPITIPEGDDVDSLKAILTARMYDIRCLIVENNELEKEVTSLKKTLEENNLPELARQLEEKEGQILALQQELFNTIQLQNRPIMIQNCTSEEHVRKLDELVKENGTLARENTRLSNALVAAKAGKQRDRLKELTDSNRILLDELHSKDEEIELLKMSMSLSESVTASRAVQDEVETLTAQLNERDATIQSLLESLKAQEGAFINMQAVLKEKEEEVENMRQATLSQERAVTHVIVASQIQTTSARNSRTLSPVLYREDDETLNLRKSLRTTSAELSLLKAKLAGTGLLDDGSLGLDELRARSRRSSTHFNIDDLKSVRDTRENNTSRDFVGIADESPFIDVKK